MESQSLLQSLTKTVCGLVADALEVVSDLQQILLRFSVRGQSPCESHVVSH